MDHALRAEMAGRTAGPARRHLAAARPRNPAGLGGLARDANLFLHYAFDMWMAREFPGVPFERYVDDAVIHCATECQARQVLAALQERMTEVGLALHPDKTRIVCVPRAQEGGVGM